MSIFTVFLKNRNFISKIKRSEVTDYAALKATAINIWPKSIFETIRGNSESIRGSLMRPK